MKNKKTLKKHDVISTFIKSATFARFALSVCAISFSCTSAAAWTYRIGKGYTICDALQKRLNSFSYPDPRKHLNNACDWNAALSYPGFKEPPWQELDLKQHQELVYRLAKYQFSNGEPSNVVPQQEPFIRQQVQEFIDQGGRVQLWRTRLISSFFNKNHPGVWAPPGPQNVVQLRHALSTVAKSDQDTLCPDIPWMGWYGSLFVANEDMTDVHPDLGYAGQALFNKSLVLFKEKPHLLSISGGLNVNVDWDSGSGVYEFCSLDYRHTQPSRK